MFLFPNILIAIAALCARLVSVRNELPRSEKMSKDTSQIHYSILDRLSDAKGDERHFEGDTARIVIEALTRLKGARLMPGDVVATCRVHSYHLFAA